MKNSLVAANKFKADNRFNIEASIYINNRIFTRSFITDTGANVTTVPCTAVEETKQMNNIFLRCARK